ncbi:hypothetical protein [Methanosarcina sp. KYL-1]|uniref:hypothetical protein n=1 Tax=Methanosarcina sp. KYL-1 TaxID=2602068 RepID=UPI002100FBB2|nr:hypothetical protein [Methanosarcina sp. KYL-1]
MEHYQGQMPEAAVGAKPEEDRKEEPRKSAAAEKIPTSKELLEAPLVLDQQCIMDLFTIKRQFRHASNNQIIMVALKMGLNQLSLALDMLSRKLEDETPRETGK